MYHHIIHTEIEPEYPRHQHPDYFSKFNRIFYKYFVRLND